jgi:hypothetical protein
VAVAIVLVIGAVQGIEVEDQIAVEARLESALRVAVTLARVIDLAALETAALELAETALGVATWEAVPGVASETVLDTAPEMPAQVATGALRASAVRVEDSAAEQVAEVLVAVAAEVVAVVAEAVVAGEN